MNFLLRHWRLLPLKILIQIGTATHAPLIISPVTWIVLLCVNAIMEVNKFKSAMEQVCVFCILLILQLILLLVLLHCEIFCMCLKFSNILFPFINFLVIMTYSLNTILGIFLLRINGRGKFF